MTRILAINGSYRDDGATDQVVDIMAKKLLSQGAEVDVVQLRDYPIEFCLNCRECTQQPGKTPGKCVLDDGMYDLVMKIERSDGLILASPTNFGSVTALFKRFMERLVVYAYWPWGSPAPTFRKADENHKKAVLVSSSGAPGIMGRWLFGTHKQLRTAAKTIGAKNVGSMFSGFASNKRTPQVSDRLAKKAERLATKLLADPAN